MNYTNTKTPGEGRAKASQKIALDTKVFKDGGGRIQKIPNGVTGIAEKPKKGLQITFKSK